MEETELISLAKSGDQYAQSQLIESYKGLVIKIVNDYTFCDGQKEELIQEGTIGLFEALNNYKLDSKAKFSTYAFPYIKNKVLRCLNIITTNKHIPDNVIRQYVLIKRKMNEFFQENGYEASYEELADLLEDTSSEKIFNVIKTIEEAHSIDDENGAILDIQHEQESISVEYKIEDIDKYYSLLKPIEKQVLQLRIEGYRYKEIVKAINLTENKIRKLECSALIKIRKQVRKEEK